MRAFSTALDAIPLALAENSGLSPIETLADVKSRQVTEKDSKLGIDCNGRGENGVLFSARSIMARIDTSVDMRKQFVYDPLISKRQQYLLATQVRFISSSFDTLSDYPFYTASPRCSQNWSVIFVTFMNVLTDLFVDDVIVAGEAEE